MDDPEFQLIPAFSDLMNSVEKTAKAKLARKEAIRNLKISIQEQSDQLERLKQILEQVRVTSQERIAEKKQEIVKQKLNLLNLEKKEGYWSTISDAFRSIFRAHFTCSKTPARTVTFGHFVNNEDKVIKPIVLKENPSAEEVQDVWDDLRELCEPKKLFLEKCSERMEETNFQEKKGEKRSNEEI